MGGSAGWPGVAVDRIVAVLAVLDTGKVQVGSGYLVDATTVLTARHCLLDKITGRRAARLRVFRASGGASVEAQVAAEAIDVGVLRIAAFGPPFAALQPPVFGRVSRDDAARLQGCQAAGFPLWQVNPGTHDRQIADVHGHISTLVGRETGEFVMRDPLLAGVGVPEGLVLSPLRRAPASPWGGLSGALVFHAGYALGVIVRHEPWLGGAALTILSIERVAEAARKGDAAAAEVMAALGFSAPAWTLPLMPLPQASAAGRERLCIGVRAEGHPLPAALQGTLSWILVAALRAAGIDPDLCARQDEFDGRHVVTLPGEVHLASAVPALVRGLELAAGSANAVAGSAEHVRIAVALACGTARPRGDAFTGQAVSDVLDMLGESALRGRLRLRRETAVAFAFADDLHRLLCSQAPGRFSPADFRPLRPVLPGIPLGSGGWLYTGDADAWSAPGTGSNQRPGPNQSPDPGLPGRRSVARQSPLASAAAARAAFVFAAVPLADAARWLYDHHVDAGPQLPQTPAEIAHAANPHLTADPFPQVPAAGSAATAAAGFGAVDDEFETGHGHHHAVPDSAAHPAGDGGSAYPADADAAPVDGSTGAEGAEGGATA